MKRFQLVWWGWQYATIRPVFQFRRIEGSLGLIYRWSLIAGPVELRRWA